MSYTVHGRLEGRRVSITWDDGALSGDQTAVDILQIRAKVLEGTDVGPPTGPYTVRRHLADPLSTIFLMRDLLGEDITADGDVPEPPPVPDGAVI
jgi:hypothetical protein